MKNLLSILLLLNALATLNAAPRYRFQDLGEIFGTSYGPSINAVGEVVATRYSPNGVLHAYQIAPGEARDFGGVDAENLPNRCEVADLAGNGDVVGFISSGNSTSLLASFGGAAAVEIAPPVGTPFAQGIAINASGLVALVASGVTYAYQNGGGYTRLSPIGTGYSRNFPVAVSEGGVIYGGVGAEGEGAQPFAWRPATNALSILPGFPGAEYTNVSGANNAGQLIGTADGNVGWTRIGTAYFALPGGISQPLAVSDAGLIVGRNVGNIPYRAVMWENLKTHDLTTLTPDAPATLEIATDINAAGQIVGYYASRSTGAPSNQILARAFLLTPIPPTAPTVRVKGKKTVRTTDARVVLRGAATDPDADLARVEVKVGRAKWKKARGLANWRFVARRLDPGRTVVRVRAIDATDLRSRPAKLIVQLQPKA